MNSKSRTGLIIAIICLFGFAPKPVQEFSWSSIGPGGGGWLTAITVVNDAAHTVYVACDVGGIYKSTDHGQTWQIKNSGLSTYYVQDIAVDPTNSSILYAATRGGIFKSVDGGENWVIKRNGFPQEEAYFFSAPVGDIVIDPASPEIVYAAIGVPRNGYKLNSFYWQSVETKGAIYKSGDHGENWTLIRGTGIDTNAMVYSLTMDPGNSNIIYAATSSGVYKSIDAGASWTGLNNGLPSHLLAMTIVINPADTNIMYVTMWAEPSSPTWQGGIYKSVDGGQTWTEKNNGLPQAMGSEAGFTSNYPTLVIDSTNPGTLYAGHTPWTPDPGVYKTVDGGDNWTWVSRQEDSQSAGSKNVTMGWITEHGLFVKCLAIDPGDPDRLYFGTSTHVFTTSDAGATWTQAYTESRGNSYWKGNGMETTCVQDIVVDPSNSRNVYAGYWDMGFLKSTDGGASFKRTFTGMTYDANTFSIIVDPENTGVIYAAAGWWEQNQGTVSKSSDYGETWTNLDNGLPDATIWSIAMDVTSPADSKILYAASYDNGIYKTTNGGQSWTAVNNGLGTGGNLQVRKIIVDPVNPSVIYAGIEVKTIENGSELSTIQGGIFKSTDAGANWTRSDTASPQLSVWDIAVVPGNSSIIYTAVSSEYDHTLKQEFSGGVYKSTDGGQTWTAMNQGFGSEENLNVSSLAISPADSEVLYAATTDAPFHDKSSGRGIYKSTDGAKTWQVVNTGLGILNFDVITIDPSDSSILYAGSGGNGIWKGIVPQYREVAGCGR